MKSKADILEEVKSGRESECLDGRDFSRLIGFFDIDEWGSFGFSLKDGAEHTPLPLTKEEVIKKLEVDLKFAFEKALSCRGISSGLMYEVIKMWMWVLDDDLQFFNNYSMYGLPLFKAVAIKYGFPNEIGNDSGSESKYNE